MQKYLKGMVFFFEAGDHERLAGKMQLHSRLAFDENGIPMLYVFDCCKDFIRTIPTLTYDHIKTEDIDSSCEDHIFTMKRGISACIVLFGNNKTSLRKKQEDPLNLFVRQEPVQPFPWLF